ncbi:MAG: hypothetical protein JW716_01860 [Candidatus Aenigmarchaeota archaeon]|nr:hypothetical protein [Candidatus Aenigmarchaeota archaeon]
MTKYSTLVNEWNSLSLVVSIMVGFSMLGLVMGIIHANNMAITLTIAVLLALSIFEYKAREIYVESREYLENELFRSAGMKGPKVKEVITKGAVKRR